jgi:hypothetical protein
MTHDFLDGLQRCSRTDLDAFIYPPESEFLESHFFQIFNGLEASRLAKRVCLTSLPECIKAHATTTPCEGGAIRHAPKQAVDYGFTGLIAAMRDNSVSGHSLPPCKPITKDPRIMKAFKAMDNFAYLSRTTWRPDLSPFQYLDDSPASMIPNIQVGPAISLQSARLGVTSPSKLMGCHHDSATNSRHCEEVFCVSAIVGHKRVEMHFQQKKSISDVLETELEQGTCLDQIVAFYNHQETSRRKFGNHLRDGTPIEAAVPGFKSISIPCNMDPAGYGQPVVYYTVLLSVRFSLSLPEIFSVHRAYFIKPDTCEFFSAASRILLELGPGNFPGASRGYAFGWTLGKIVNDLRTRDFHRGRKKPPHRRSPFRILSPCPTWNVGPSKFTLPW